ncbi:MAG: Holliday junction resolvase, partial [Thermoplasmatales archaeon]|nr:Holliday junction resolvase [Thermoplasmatales archaeon]
VATRGDISFLTEVKTSIGDTLHFSSVSGKLQKQAETMIEMCEKTKNLPIYAFRTKGYRGDSWRIFTMDVNGLEGRASVLHKRLPKIEKSKSGNFVMRWKEGMPLSDFISYLCK